MPHVPTNIKPMAFGVDMQSCEAVIPGDGNDVICMTYTYDMAVFIARLLEVEHWEEFSVVVGDEVTFNQLVEVGERIRGKFLLFYCSGSDSSIFCRVCVANPTREEIQGGV